jgi:F-type H+-transporting ATPase subunit b
MITSQLPFADIIQNFKDIGEKTGFNPAQFLAQCVAVTCLFILLNKLAWTPVRRMLDERRKVIADSIANADKIKKELSDAEATRIGIIQKANDQANKIIAEAEKSAAAVTARRAEEATRQAQDIVKSAHEAAVLDRNRLMAELKGQIGDLVIQTTQKVTGKVLNADDQARLNTETLREVEARNN